jgi:hypothetical protein
MEVVEKRGNLVWVSVVNENGFMGEMRGGQDS